MQRTSSQTNNSGETREESVARVRSRVERAFSRFQQRMEGLAARRRAAVDRALKRGDTKKSDAVRKQLGL